MVPATIKPLGIETGTKLYLSNLDYGVSTYDLKASHCNFVPYTLLSMWHATCPPEVMSYTHFHLCFAHSDHPAKTPYLKRST